MPGPENLSWCVRGFPMKNDILKFKISQALRPPAIEVYPGRGFLLQAPAIRRAQDNGGAFGRRAVIAGWSASSRRRLRLVLLTQGPPAGWSTWGPSITIPGDVESLRESKKRWDLFCRQVRRAGWCMVWRVEVQTKNDRGALHYHGVLYTPAGFSLEDMKARLWSMWSGLLGSRAALPGAREYCLDIQENDIDQEVGAWLRYIQDHASKLKQAGEYIGRHWGVVGREHLTPVAPEVFADLSRAQYFQVVRVLQRLARPSFKAPLAPFGRRLGYRPRRGSWGRSVWFSRPDTLARVLEWVK